MWRKGEAGGREPGHHSDPGFTDTPSSSSAASQPSQQSLIRVVSQFEESLMCAWVLYGCMWVSCVLCVLRACASGEVGREGNNMQRGGESRRHEGGGGAQTGGWLSQGS